MAKSGDSFFTTVGCIDGRVQEAVAGYGREKFSAVYPDTITEAGLDGLLGHLDEQSILEPLKQQILISVDKHHSKGILVHGHQDCAGNPVSETEHKDDIAESVAEVKEMVKGKNIPVVGIYIKFDPDISVIELKNGQA